MAERRAAYQQHLDKYPAIRAKLASFVSEMVSQRQNAKVKMWANVLPWDQAFLVARYGEAVEQWPTDIGDGDELRAWRWVQQGDTPAGITYLAPSKSLGGITIGLLLAIFAVTQVGVWALLGVGMLLPFVFGTAMSDYLEGQIRAHIFRTASFTKPTGLTVHLYTAAPGETGGGTEVTGGSYASVSRDPLDANWTAASATDGLTDNAAAITFPAPTANWGQVTHFAIKDQSANFLIYGALTTPKTVNNGDPAPSFGVGALDITFA
jgi:hypothetical protein